MGSTLNIPRKRRILIVDNDPLVRRGLTELIDGESDLEVIASTATNAAAIAVLGKSRPDLVITDLSLEGVDDGLNLVTYIRANHANQLVLVFTMHAFPYYADLALQAGANGYITKQELMDTLLNAIRRVLAGERYVHPSVGRIGKDIH